MSGSSELFHFATDQARAWVRTNGTRAGTDVAYAGLKPFLLASVAAFEAQGGERFDMGTVGQVIEAVARWWSRAGWGHFARRGLYRYFVRFGRGVHPRGPEVPHLKASHYQPRQDAAIEAIGELMAAGIEKPTQRQIAELASERSGLDVTRSSAREWSAFESPRLAAALDALPATVAALARALRADLPLGMVHVVALADVAASLWTPSTCESTQRVHRKRAADAMMRIGAKRVGLTVAIAGDVVIVGRQRSIPADPAAFAAHAKVRKLRIGRVAGASAQAVQDRFAALEMIQYVEAFQDQVQEEADALIEQYELREGMSYEAATRQVIADSAVVRLGRRGLIDDSVAAAMGVLPRQTFESVLGGPVRSHMRVEDHDRHEREHFEAFGELHARYGRGECFGSIYRWIHERGGLPMAPSARSIAEALDGITDIAAAEAALPAVGQPGRRRVYASTTLPRCITLPVTPRIAQPILAAPRRSTSVPQVPRKIIEIALPEIVLTPEQKEAVDAGMPLWFAAA